MHLAGNDSFFRLGSNVHTGHHQFTVQYLCFEQHANFPADKPGINTLNRWLECCREVGELHHLRFVQQFPPLQVAMILGREFAEKRVIFIQENTSCVRRAHLEPGSIPEYRSKVLFNFFSVLYFAGCRNQDISPFFQYGNGFFIQCVGSIYTSLCQFHLCRIYPEIPVIDGIAAFNTYFQI